MPSITTPSRSRTVWRSPPPPSTCGSAAPDSDWRNDYPPTGTLPLLRSRWGIEGTMMSNLPVDEQRTEPLARLLSAHFKGQLKEPWPTAPYRLGSEPSVVVAERMALAEAPHDAKPARDNNARARYTLAASVVLLLGTCWYLSTGFESAYRNGPTTPSPGGMLGGAGASKPAALEELKRDAAIKGEKEPPRSPMRL